MKNTKLGLSTEEAKESKKQNGSNALTREKTGSFLAKFWGNLNDPIIRILLIALGAEVVLTLGKVNWAETLGILIAILVATTVSTVSEWGSEAAFVRMQNESKNVKVRAFRDGVLGEIGIDEIVTGDVLRLSAGEGVPADLRVIEGRFSVNQSALNGESVEVEKSAGDDARFELSNPALLFRGSVVTEGEGLLRAERVGVHTYYGQIARDVQTQTRESPLKLRLKRLASDISKIGYVIAAIVALTYIFNETVSKNGFIWSQIRASFSDVPFLLSTLVHALTLMITVIVVAVPEGLPMMITVVLSANMKKMAKDGVLVKKLVGIETAGSMNMLFTDKTGTLTAGVLSLDRFVSADGEIRGMSALKKQGALFEMLCLSCLANTDAVVSGRKLIGGNATDRALTGFFLTEGAPPFTVIRKTPFSSEKKYAKAELSDKTAFYKGAPEVLLPLVRRAVSSRGDLIFASPDDLKARYLPYAKNGDRVIALCMQKEGEDGLTFLAFAILHDRLRADARDTVKTLRRAGVHVCMVTGDGKETATAIAYECGVLSHAEDAVVLDRREVENLSDGELKQVLPHLAVLSRALPSDKRRLVRLAQENGAVVGMTGDGINDAPSLKLADVGFAMGNGADIAKDAADVVLLDNSIRSVENTVLYGRTIFKSIRKFITFQLIMNFAACFVSLIGQWMGFPAPITIVQMLWVNMIMDTLGGLAFAGEPPLAYTMREKPKKREEPILSPQTLATIAWNGGFTLTLCVLFLGVPLFANRFRSSADALVFLTGFYALFIFLGLANALCARTERLRLFSGISKNRGFVFILLFIAIVQILMIYFGGTLFRTTPLTFRELTFVILLSATVFPVDFTRKLFIRLCKNEKNS